MRHDVFLALLTLAVLSIAVMVPDVLAQEHPSGECLAGCTYVYYDYEDQPANVDVHTNSNAGSGWSRAWGEVVRGWRKNNRIWREFRTWS